jgi:hypothetical protein
VRRVTIAPIRIAHGATLSNTAPWIDLCLLALWAIAGLFVSATLLASGLGAEIAQAFAIAG